MERGFFVTATDTFVGKTVVSGAMIRALTILGYRVAAMKPVETGCLKDGKMLVSSDGAFLKKLTTMEEKINVVSPYMFEAPLSPYEAARKEKKEISTDKIFKAYDGLLKNYDAVVVEGAGGLYVPLTKDYFMSDLAREMELPLIVVARPGLGTLNHTMLTIEHARSKGLVIAGVIFNYIAQPEGTPAEEMNPRTLRELTDIPFIGTFPYLPVLEEEIIDRTVLKNIDMGLLKKAIAV